MARLAPSVRQYLLVCLLFGVPVVASAQTTLTVADETQLQNALSIVSPGDTIRFTANITLTSALPAIMTDNITVDGGGFTLSGANQYRGLIVGDASGFSTPPPISVVIQNLAIANTVGTGGPGQPGLEGGGGGSAGIGGALIVANTATVTLSGVSITSSSAVGGFGGSAPGPIGALNGGFAVSPSYSGGNGGANPTAGAFGGGGGGSTLNPGAGSAFAGGTGSATGGGGGGAGLGGGIFVQSGGSLVIGPGVSINGNTVTGGAAGPGAANGGAYGSGLFLEGSGTITFATGAGTTTLNDAIVDTRGASGGSLPQFWSLAKGDAGTLVLGGANLYSGSTEIGGGTLSVASDSNLGLAWTLGGGDVTVRGGAALQITGNSAFQRPLFIEDGATLRVGTGVAAAWDGAIADVDIVPAGLIVTGGGTLALNNPLNTFSNGLRIVGNSTVEFSNDGALGAAGLGVQLGDASSAGTLRLAGGNVGSARNVTLGGVGVGTFEVAGGGMLALSGQITGTGILGKAGAGTLVLSGANSYTGGTRVVAGALAAGAANVFGTGRMDVLAGATLNLNGFDQAVGSITGAGNITLGTATLAAGGDNTSTTLSGVISGAGSLVKTGTGSLTLTGANTYSGGTTVSQGSLIGDTTSLQGNIQNGGVVEFSQASSGTYAGVMTGAGSLIKSGGAALTLTGANTYHGGTTISAGLLLGSSSSLQGNILNNSALQFDQVADGTYAGIISGTGTFTKSGAGTLTLAGSNTFTGATAIDAGVLRAGAPNVFGTSTVAVASGATFDLNGFNQRIGGLSGGGSISLGSATLTAGVGNGSTTLGGVISGTGALVKEGTGTLTLTGANTYSGGTTVSAGTLVGTSSSLQGRITTSGLVVFNQAVAGTFNGSLSGSGSFQKLGAGTLTLAAASTFTGTTTISAGVLRAGVANAFSSSGPIVIGAGTTLDLNGFSHTLNALSGPGDIALGSATLTTGTDGGSMTIGGDISGSGSLVKAGSGTLALTGANTYSGGTTVSGGILLGNTVSLQGDILNDARVVFDQGFNGTYAGSMSGSGILEKAGSGTLTLSGLNTHAGGTVIGGGSIVGTTASLAGEIVNNGSLTFGGSSDGAFRGTLGGRGSLWKTGSSTMTLNGAHLFSGLTTVSHGTLALNGTLAGSVVVEPGAEFLASGGLLGGLTLNGGRLRIPTPAFASAPAVAASASRAASAGDRLNTPPLFTIGGNLIAGPGSVLSIPVGPGPNPTLQVNGVAALNGASLDATPIELGTRRNLSFLALTAATGLTVGNSTVATQNPLLLSSLRQDGNTLAVTIVNLGVPLEGAVSPTFASVGGALDSMKGDLSGDRGFVLRELFALDDDQLDDAMRMIAGEVHASNRHIEIRSSEAFTDLVRNEITEREHETEDGQTGWGGPTVRWFGQFSREHVSFGPQNDALGGGADITDGAGGFEYKLSDRLLVGGGGGLGFGSMALDGLSAASDISAPRAFGVIGFKPKGFGIRGGGSFSRSKAKSSRRILIVALLPPELGGLPLTGGIDREAKSEEVTVQSDQWSEYADHLDFGTYRLDYMFGVRRARFARDGFTETGAGALSLEYDGGTLNLTDTDVKVHWWRRKGGVRPYVETFFRHSSGFDFELPVEFADEEDSDFKAAGLPMGQSAFAARAGVTFVRRLGSFTFEYRIRKATGQTAQSGDMRFRF